MKLGVFDHLDRNDVPLHDFYEQRLQLVEAYDRGGFYSYRGARADDARELCSFRIAANNHSI